jgi:hypothetical protein
MSGAAPESWDDQDMSNPMTKLNINASEFVPSWGPPSNNGPKGGEETSSTNHNKRSPTNSASPMQVDSPAHQAGSSGGGVGPTEKESWEDTDNSAATPATTPEDEENSMENEAHFLSQPQSLEQKLNPRLKRRRLQKRNTLTSFSLVMLMPENRQSVVRSCT